MPHNLRHQPLNSIAKATQWDGTTGRVISSASNDIFVKGEGFAGLGERGAGKSERIAGGGKGFAKGGEGVARVGNVLASCSDQRAGNRRALSTRAESIVREDQRSFNSARPSGLMYSMRRRCR